MGYKTAYLRKFDKDGKCSLEMNASFSKIQKDPLTKKQAEALAKKFFKLSEDIIVTVKAGSDAFLIKGNQDV